MRRAVSELVLPAFAGALRPVALKNFVAVAPRFFHDDVTIVEPSSQLEEVKLKEEAKLDVDAVQEAKDNAKKYALKLQLINPARLTDDMFHRGGAREGVVAEYYSQFSKDETMLAQDNREPVSSACDGKVKFYSASSDLGSTILAKVEHNVVGRLFLGNEHDDDVKHLSVLNVLPQKYLQETFPGQEIARDEILCNLFLAYQKQQALDGKIVSSSLQTSCIGDYFHLLEKIAPESIKREDGSVRRLFRFSDLLENIDKIIDGKEEVVPDSVVEDAIAKRFYARQEYKEPRWR